MASQTSTASRPPKALRFDAGTTWLNLLATVRRPLGDDRLERMPTPALLAEWLARSGLRPVNAPVGRDLRRAVQLREALRSVALATATTASPDPSAVGVVNRWLATSPGRLRAAAGEDGAIALAPPANTSQALARIARQAAGDLASPMTEALRACQADDCGALFLDPGGRRRWCSSATCGNRERVRAHRERLRDS